MSEDSGVILSLLSVLKAPPFWLLIGLALAGYAVLFVPPIAGINFDTFRQQWGALIWAEAITFSILAVTRTIETLVNGYRERQHEGARRRVLRFVHLDFQTWWHLAKQQDDSFNSQILADIQVSNLSDQSTQIVKVQMVRPRANLLHTFVSPRVPIPAHGAVPIRVNIMARGSLGRQGKPIRITLALTDQHGEEYKLKNLVVSTRDKVPNPISLMERGFHAWSYLLRLLRLRSAAAEQEMLSILWTYKEGYNYLVLCQAILEEERRSYAARGRRMGKLGSLNVGVRSEPNNGWTQEGRIPELLWMKGEGTRLSSKNLDQLLGIHADLNKNDRKNLENYLLAQLSKASSFADVGYFIFLALHRMGHTVEALRTARTNLAGDKVHGYSNILATMSALVSHEHADIAEAVLVAILNTLSGDGDNDFLLKQKINAARLERIGGTESSHAGNIQAH